MAAEVETAKVGASWCVADQVYEGKRAAAARRSPPPVAAAAATATAAGSLTSARDGPQRPIVP